MAILQRMSVLMTGLLTGLDAVFLAPVNRAYKTLSGTEYTSAHRSMVQVAGPTAPLLAMPLLLTNALLLLKMRRRAADGAFACTTLSSLCLLLNAAITFTVNIPINRRFLRASAQSPPDDWASLRDRWATAHNTRTAVQFLGFVALLVGLIGPHPSGSEVD